ncbi:mRNA decay activator protein ZFP36 [Nosema granulosis]|uniref:mRNA decay activator protein ZFP36 n=1 Tax=Nosema granulosis TaxID=83296 RepID=A0A9P6H1E7_9MICR|nr:mRNA decay activator protein ZFP36 [Nosema granulosis]
MRIGGKDMKNINIDHFVDPHADVQESEDFNIKEYIISLMDQTDVLDNNVTKSTKCNILKEDDTLRNYDILRNYDTLRNDDTFLKENNTLLKEETFDIKTKPIDHKDTKTQKNCKGPVAKNSKYFINKKYQLYKTEICRSHSEVGYCKYGSKCQFAHNPAELRDVVRHPRYKTETCRTFWEEGSCPYGKRCCFIHVPKNSASVFKDLLAPQLAPDMVLNSTSIVEENQASEIFDKLMFREIESELINDDLFVQNTKNNFIEFKDMDESTKLKICEIKVSDFDIDYSEPKKPKIPVDKYEIDEVYVNSLFVQEQRPFWSTNEANLWSDNCLFYIKGINKSHR